MKNCLAIRAVLSELSFLREEVSRFIGEGLDDIEKSRVTLAIDEAVTNVIVHGYNSDPGKSLDIEMLSSADSFTFIITDSAPDYNPLESPAPDIESYQENGEDGGLGVDLYRRIMKAEYEKKEGGGNRLILVKEKNA